MTSQEETLRTRIQELEQQLKEEREKNASTITIRDKIPVMSSEVVDSNPYR